MVITIPARSQSGNGPRQVDPNKDLPQLIELLRLVFGKELDADGQQFLRNLPDGRTPAIFWRLDPMMSRLIPGYIWEVDGRLVGNVTLLPTRTNARYLVANVAVHPDFRRRGIARMLMAAVQEEVHRRQGKAILLQVDYDNESALGLYQSLGYEMRGSMTTWRTSVSRVRDLPLDGSSDDYRVNVRKFDSRRWKEAYQLDSNALVSDLHWPEALEVDGYKRSVRQRASDFLNGRFRHSWMTLDDASKMNGLATIYGEWGRSHQLVLRVHPSWKGRLERPLMQKMIDGLRDLPRRNIQLIHLADDDVANQLLLKANFSRHRTLSHMRLGIN